MPHLNNNLWGTLPEVKEIRRPVAHLKQQASVLQILTHGQITAELAPSPDGNVHFRIVVPWLGNYRATLVSVSTPIPAYPCNVSNSLEGGPATRAANEDEFVAILARILQSKGVQNLIANILGQLKAEGKLERQEQQAPPPARLTTR